MHVEIDSQERLGQLTGPILSSDSDQPQQNTSRGRWTRYFLLAETATADDSLHDALRRVGWISLAMIAQALNEIDRNWYLSFVPFLKPFAMLIPFMLILASFAAMWMALRPSKPRSAAPETEQAQEQQEQPRHARRWQRIVLILALLASLGGAAEMGRAIVVSFFSAPQYTNDGTSLDLNAAILLSEGRNPYTDSNILDVLARFHIQPYWTTPLLAGQLAHATSYPSASQMSAIMAKDMQTGSTPEFESKVSYPALSFLSMLPFVWLNLTNVLPLYFFCYLAIVAIGWKIARPEMRPWVILLSLANVSLWTSVVGGNLDLLYILFILLSWLLMDRRWWSAIFLGLAAATKQPAWLFIPFYAILTWRQYGPRETARRLTIAGAVFLAFNLPFILWNPQAWFTGMLVPIADPMFALGDGLIGLSTSSLLPYLPTFAYSMLEILTMLACLAWYWRNCEERPEAAMLLAFVPLFFAWRSLPSYFYCSALPLFILQMARMLPRKKQEIDGDGTASAVPEIEAVPHKESRELAGAGIGTRAALRMLLFFNL